jgi:hypothetical protein
MPRTFSLASYLVKVRDVSEKEDEILSDLPDDRDLVTYLNEQLAAMKETKHNEESQQVLAVSKLVKSGRTLTGIIETGDYGTESNIYSVAKKQVVYKRQTQDADLWPFYFTFDIPEGTDEGLLILQRTGNYGVRHVLYRFLYDCFTNDFVDLKLRLDPIVDPEQIAKYSHGVVQELRFIRVTLPPDLADRYDSGHKEFHGRMELVVKARRGGALPLQKYVSKLMAKGERGGIFAIGGGQFEYDDIRMKARVGGTSRTFSLRDPKLRSYHDVTDVVKMGAGGHPTFDSMNEAAMSLAEKLKAQIYG